MKLLQLGTIKQGGAGCICPESALLNNLVTHLLVARNEVVILDMEAGIEHLGRGTAKSVDAFVIVVEPIRRSMDTAAHPQAGHGHRRAAFSFVGNKVRDDGDRAFIRGTRGHSHRRLFPRGRAGSQADREGVAVFDAVPEFAEQEAVAQAVGRGLRRPQGENPALDPGCQRLVEKPEGHILTTPAIINTAFDTPVNYPGFLL